MVDCNFNAYTLCFQIPQNQRKWSENWFVSFFWCCLLPQCLTRRLGCKGNNGNGAMENETLRFVNRVLHSCNVACVLVSVHITHNVLHDRALSVNNINIPISNLKEIYVVFSFLFFLLRNKTLEDLDRNWDFRLIDLIRGDLYVIGSGMLTGKSKIDQHEPGSSFIRPCPPWKMLLVF